jgi:hypothetical protein
MNRREMILRTAADTWGASPTNWPWGVAAQPANKRKIHFYDPSKETPKTN